MGRFFKREIKKPSFIQLLRIKRRIDNLRNCLFHRKAYCFKNQQVASKNAFCRSHKPLKRDVKLTQ